MRNHFFQSLILVGVVLVAGTRSLPARAVETVHFRSGDGQTELIGYLFRPGAPGPHAVVVMLHGRGGPYSSLAKGVYNGHTLSKRHKFWGELWASQGYVALLVDSFGPRGYWRGFPRASYDDRPSEVSEQAVRPLDAYGALSYLRTRPDVIRDRIGLQGWSNGAMTALAAMSARAPGIANPSPRQRVPGGIGVLSRLRDGGDPGCVRALRSHSDVRRNGRRGSVR